MPVKSRAGRRVDAGHPVLHPPAEEIPPRHEGVTAIAIDGSSFGAQRYRVIVLIEGLACELASGQPWYDKKAIDGEDRPDTDDGAVEAEKRIRGCFAAQIAEHENEDDGREDEQQDLSMERPRTERASRDKVLGDVSECRRILITRTNGVRRIVQPQDTPVFAFFLPCSLSDFNPALPFL